MKFHIQNSVKNGIDQRKVLDNFDHHQKEMAKINILADKYKKQTKRENVR